MVGQNEGSEVSDTSTGQKPGNRFARLGMAACCIIMMVPIALVLLGGASIGAVFSNAGLILPLVLCLGMHFVMHRMMGRSCHGKVEEADDQFVDEQLLEGSTDRPVIMQQRGQN